MPTTLFKPHTPHEHTVISQEAIDECSDCENDIGTTLFGETINRSYCSCDSLYIFDPTCEENEDHESYSFHAFDNLGTVSHDIINVATVFNPFAESLINNKKAFQFVIHPGTSRQAMVRAESDGTLQCFDEMSWKLEKLPFFVCVDSYPNCHIGIKGRETTFGMIDEDGNRTGERRKGLIANMSGCSLWIAKGVFDSLIRLEENTEGFALV